MRRPGTICLTMALSGLLFITSSAAGASFTVEQRHEIVAILLEALRADPSIISEAMQAARAEEGIRRVQAVQAAIVHERAALVANEADPVAGNRGGDVSVVVFYDTRCPYCRRMTPVLNSLIEADRGVRLVFKDLPLLGPPSELEARALLASQQQGGYLRLQDALMRGEAPPPSPDGIRERAEQLGMDGSRLLHDMEDASVRARLEANAKLSRDVGVIGTPSMVVGERLIPGAVDLAELRAAVDLARQHPASGTATP